MKLTELQKYRVKLGYENLNKLLIEIKQKSRKGKEKETMELLESAVQHLEAFRMKAS